MPEFTVADVKALLDIRGDARDAYIGAILPVVIEGTREYLGQEFKDDAGADDFPALVRLGMAKWVEANTNPAGVKQHHRGDVSTTYETDPGIPASARVLFDQWTIQTGQVKRGTFGFVRMPKKRRTAYEELWNLEPASGQPSVLSLDNPDPEGDVE